MSKDWYLSSSDDYLSGYENEEFSLNATSAFEELLVNSPEAYVVSLNAMTPLPAIVQDTGDSEKKNLLTRIDSVKRGDMIAYKGRDWLIVDYVDDNKMNQSSEMQLCNAFISIQGNVLPPEPIEYDDWDNPIYPPDYNPDEQGIPIPCIASKTNVIEDGNRAIVLEEDRIRIIIQYMDFDFSTFSVYGDEYTVKSIDKTKSIDGKGLLIIFGERSK